jgi:hypothetical protein
MDSLFITLAYKYVALSIMLAEINFCAKRLNLPIRLPLSEKDIQPESHVSPPRLMGLVVASKPRLSPSVSMTAD